MNLINLTPHALTLIVNGDKRTLSASGSVARVSVKQVETDTLDGIPVVENVYGSVEGLPEPVEGTAYIVSALVGGQVHGRSDVFGPDTGNTAIRENGQVVGVVRFVQFK